MHTRDLARRALLLAAALPAAALPLGGCVTRITSGGDGSGAVVTEADAGPFPEDYQAIVRRWFAENVRVLATIRECAATRPVPGRADQGILFGAGDVTGWQTTGVASGVDSIGMTTGHITYSILIRDGRVVAHQKLLR